MHQFKRFYLLGAMLLSLCIPLITISYETEAIELPAQIQKEAVFIKAAENNNIQQSVWSTADFFPYILWAGYMIGFSVFGFRFLRNLLQFRNKIRFNRKVISAKYTNVLLRKKTAPHSFLKYIFLNKNDFEEDKIAPEILQHEQAHVLQKHTWDILLVEVLQIIFWFNPLFIMYKRSIRVNHEFLADASVIAKDHHILTYSQLLVHYSAGAHHNAMSSAFNHSLTRLTIFGKKIFKEKPGRQVKKRILMISKPFSEKRMAARLSLLPLVIALCLFLFNNEIVAKPSAKTGKAPDKSLLHPKPIEQVSMKSFLQQKEKSISILISGENVMLNGEKARLKNFSNKLNEVTEGWTEEEIKNTNLNISISNAEESFLKKLNQEYLKTKFAKIKGGSLLPPPPPEPPHEKLPTPPPPPAMEKTNVPAPAAPPAPPAPDSLRLEKRRSEAMQLNFSKDSARLQERLEQRMALMQEREAQMQERQEEFVERQEEFKSRQQELQSRMEISDDMRAQMEERRKELEKRRRQMLMRRDSVFRIIRDSIR
ncbi:M56 family metallopeptidase [Zunongwangia sp. H14]|uniref:M56 family metallopeptidase n=1 Tax=Zunongwangia sp. H14 TaxID=3240792 RepID=UPI00356714D5